MRLPAICEKTGLNKGAWTAEEDELLSSYMRRYGHENWGKLPKKAGPASNLREYCSVGDANIDYQGLNRTGKSCRLRWLNYLRPDLKKGNFTAEEESLVLNLHQQFGNSWSRIAASLPGRSDNEIKNYWHTSSKKRSVPNQATQKPKSAPKSFVQEDIDLVILEMKDPVADEMNPESVATAWSDLVELEFMLENISSLEKCYGEIGFEINPDNNITSVLDFPEGFFSPFVADGEGQITNCLPIEETTIPAEAYSETDGNYWSGEMFLLSQNLDMAFVLDEASLLPPFHPPGEALYENPYPFYNGYHG